MTTGLPLSGKAALVTGGAGGIGSACARALVRDGAAVTLMGRTRDTLEATAAELRASVSDGGEVNWFVGDGMEAEAVEGAVARASSALGGLHICVATVGGGTIAPFLLLDEHQLLEELRRNIVGAFLAIKYAVPPMVASGGSIVCISSDAATMSWPFMAGYCAGKAGLDALVRVAADEFGYHDVRVNAVRPGLTKTASNNVSLLFSDPEILEEFKSQKPLGRTGTPEDIAAGVRFLAGPESAWVTGQSLAIEGGNELRRAPSLEKIARLRFGDETVDTAISGRIP
ncbi:MAG TPA: SDR family NAD(P)-dependent oxidoreductase [Acidimicrobiales bacterium]